MDSSKKSSDCTPTLNSHCLAEIFSYLKYPDRFRMSSVCRKWNDAVKLTWQDTKIFSDRDKKIALHFRDHESHRPPKLHDIQTLIKKCGCFLKKLELVGRVYRDNTLKLLIKECRNLTELKIKMFFDKKRNYNDLFTNFPKLKSVYLDVRYKYGERMNEDKYWIIFQRLPQDIEEFSIHTEDYNPIKMENTFAETLEKFNNLRHLEIRNCKLNDRIMEIIEKKVKLTHLKLDCCEFNIKQFSLSNLTNLEYLHLGYTMDDNDHLINAATSFLLKLKSLHVPYKISNESLKNLKNLENLEELIMISYYGVGHDIISPLKNLKRANFLYGINLSDSDIIQLIKNSPNIEYLNIFGCQCVTAKTLEYAARITKIRLQDPPLHIVADRSIIEKAQRTCNFGPYLKVSVDLLWESEQIIWGNFNPHIH